MTFALDFVALAWLLSGLVVGVLIGRLWVRAGRNPQRVADSAVAAAAAATARTQADAAQRELAAAQAAMRPLADEVDRLKRELAKAKRPVQAPLPLDAATVPATAPATPPATAPATHVEPTRAVAGTGPIVVGDGVGTGDDAVAVPDIRQLKGVGDKFAVVLDGIGLGTVDRLARLNPDEAADADTRLGAFNGRIARDRLVEQCVLLDEGRTTEYEARFGKLGGPILV